jgi:hypothetical protein
LQIDVIPDDSDDGTPIWVFGLAILLIVTLAGAAAILYQKSGGNLKGLLDRMPSVGMQRKSTEYDAYPTDEDEEWWDSEQEPEPEAEQSEPNLERFSEYPGWLWDPSKQEWVPDPDHKGE